MNPLNKGTFLIALKAFDLHPAIPPDANQARIYSLKSLGTVNIRLSSTQQVQIGTVKDEETLGPSRCRTTGAFGLGHGGKFAANVDILSSICGFYKKISSLAEQPTQLSGKLLFGNSAQVHIGDLA